MRIRWSGITITRSPERWKQIEDIFQTTLDLAREQGTAYIERVCADDAQLRREVEALLTKYEAVGASLR